MMKITDCSIVEKTACSFALDASNERTQIVSVLDGTLNVGGRDMTPGHGIQVRKNKNMEINVDVYVKYACFCVENLNINTEDAFLSQNSLQIEALADLVCSVKNTDPNNETFFSSAAQMLISLLGENISLFSCSNSCVDIAKRYIDENYRRPIKVEDIAEYANADRKYLRNLFVKYLGVSTKEYLMNVRMDKAKELLASEEISIADVAASVGYADALAFSKIFKTHVGVSPVEFRSGEEYRPKRPAEKKIEAQTKKEDIKYFLL